MIPCILFLIKFSALLLWETLEFYHCLCVFPYPFIDSGPLNLNQTSLQGNAIGCLSTVVLKGWILLPIPIVMRWCSYGDLVLTLLN